MKKSNVMLAKDFQSSFLSVEKDSEQIINQLNDIWKNFTSC